MRHSSALDLLGQVHHISQKVDKFKNPTPTQSLVSSKLNAVTQIEILNSKRKGVIYTVKMH